MNQSKGKLYLVPCPLGDDAPIKSLPAHTLEIIHALSFFVVEDFKSGRQFIKKCQHPKAIQELQFEHFDKKTDPLLISEILAPLLQGYSMGIVSEAGCPGVADPGNALVAFAHRNNIQVVPLIGPNSIIQALMASGLNGQSFAFHGYLPKNSQELKQKIYFLEKQSVDFDQTQHFIETPYRTQGLLDQLLVLAKPQTKLCVAANLNQQNEVITSYYIQDWRKAKAKFDKCPAVFLLQA